MKRFFIVLMAFMASFAFNSLAKAEEGVVTVTVAADSYRVEQVGEQHELSVDNFGRLLVPGKPDLPGKIFAVAIPPGAEITEVTFDGGESIELPGVYRIPPASLPRVVGEEDPSLYAQDLEAYKANYQAVYGSDSPYPGKVGEFVRRAGYRKYNLADVRITPFSYMARSGKLLYHPLVTVNVKYSVPETLPDHVVLDDNMARTEATARKLVLNYDEAQAWYDNAGDSVIMGPYRYVIITLPSLTGAVQPLVDWENKKNRIVEVVTTTWIASNYSGYDLAEKTRNFLRQKYPSSEWGIMDVCMVGHYDDVPIRRTWQDVGYGKPETDFYFAELSLPDSDSWDMDGDHKWGENPDIIDFYGEINVGRIPWSDYSTVEKICQKSVAFEQNNDPAFKKSMLLLGAFFWPKTDNAVLMEYKTDPGIHPWMADWTFTKMYEQNGTCWSKYACDYPLVRSNVTSVWPAGKYSFVNWGGHGSPTSCHIYGNGMASFIRASDNTKMNDNYPAVIFAAACSNSDTDYNNIGQMMMKQGAVGFLGATKVAYGRLKWSHPSNGSCQSMDYFFTTNVTSADYSLGGGHQAALKTMYSNGYWSSVKYETFEWGAIWGNPNLTYGEVSPLHLNFPEGLPVDASYPGLETSMLVDVRDGLEALKPGTAKVHYRFDPNDPYTELPLTFLGGYLYEGVLPETNPGDEPEYYFSAESDTGSMVYSPAGAPGDVYSFEVYIDQLLMEDDFESNQGWTVENVDVTDGAWERAEPKFSFSQPGEDHSAVGTLCFVTGPKGGYPDADDVDGGPTRLVSPLFDLSCGDGILDFFLWSYHSPFGVQEPLTVEISNDGGANWTTVCECGTKHSNKWTNHIFRVSEFITPTDQMRVRFIASDNPDDDIVEGLLDDFMVKGLHLDPQLWADAYSIPTSVGAEIDFKLDAGAVHANRDYLVLASLSGTCPGFKLPGGTILPLNWDWLTDFILVCIGSPVCVDFAGTLDGQGRATATLDTLGPVDSLLIGEVANFAFLLEPPPGYDFTSNAVPVTFEP
ncbi:MAG: C25 family cysteine peptidase [Planctomycetota bacterium]